MKSSLLAPLGLALALAAGIISAAHADPAPFSGFSIPWNDSAPGRVTDLSGMNPMPAGVHGAIVVKNGHFAESGTGKRVRFLGINFFGFYGLLGDTPAQAQADCAAIAAHLAKQGYNLVRLAALDNTDPGETPGTSLWDSAVPNHLNISATQMALLDQLVYQLKRKGIYCDLILHGDRTLQAGDSFVPGMAYPNVLPSSFASAISFPATTGLIPGVPAPPNSSANFSYDKRVDEFDPMMIAADRKYASDVLSHVNPNTGLTYAADPAIAIVEINNENSLTGGFYGLLGTGLDSLPEPYNAELVGGWNAWLRGKYRNDAALNTAWRAGSLGPGLLSPSSVWHPQAQAPAAGTFSLGAGSLSGAPEEDTVTTATDTANPWRAQALIYGLSLQNGSPYTVSFRAKYAAPVSTPTLAPPSVPLAVSDDQGDYHPVGLDTAVPLTTRWKTYTHPFTASRVDPGHSRIVFSLGGALGSVSIADLQISPGQAGAGLPPGQSLAASPPSVAIPNHALLAPQQDWISYLAATEQSYAQTMRTYLKTSLQVKANVICSQMGFGGLTSLGREAPMEFADNHAYWDHPQQFSPPYSITNKPMVSDLAPGRGGGTLLALAQYRVLGKPYSVSEYNQPWPNDFRAEALPEIVSFAAYQDWDVLTLFDMGDYGTADQASGSVNLIHNPFDSLEPAKAAFMPAAAMIFRAGEIPAAPNSAVLTVAPDQAMQQQAASAWSAAAGSGVPAPSPLTQRLALHAGAAGTHGVSLRLTSPASLGVNTPRVAVTSYPSGEVYTASAAAAQILTGYVGGQKITLGSSTYAFPPFGLRDVPALDNFAALTLTAMDQKPIASSRHLLLTLAGRVENTAMQWNQPRTGLLALGSSPITMQGIPATVTLQTADAALKVWALDGTGKRTQPVTTGTAYANGHLTFTVGGRYATLWYELADQ